jgi:hypothetical protein
MFWSAPSNKRRHGTGPAGEFEFSDLWLSPGCAAAGGSPRRCMAWWGLLAIRTFWPYPHGDRGTTMTVWSADQERRKAMHAKVGDEVLVRGRHVADEDRHGTIIEIHGEGGTRRTSSGGTTGTRACSSHPPIPVSSTAPPSRRRVD